MKKIKTDRMDCSTQICSKKIKEQNNRQKLICRSNRNLSGPPPRLCHNDCSERRKSVLIVPYLNAQKCHKKVLCSKVKASAGKQMDIYRQKSLFRNSSIVIGILLGLMCCGSLHAKGKTKIYLLIRKRIFCIWSYCLFMIHYLGCEMIMKLLKTSIFAYLSWI